MLKQHLTSTGQSQRDFAAQIGIDPSYLSLLVSGKKRPSLEVAVRIETATSGAVTCASWFPAGEGEDAA